MKVLFFILFVSSLANAQETYVKSADSPSERKVGVGISFSGPVGLSLYGDVNSGNFVQGSLGFMGSRDYQATVDYAFAYRGAFAGAPTLTPYFGLGLIALHQETSYWYYPYNEDYASQTYAGARVPLGLSFVIPRTPVQLAAEIVPTMLVAPVTYTYVQGGVNARMLF